MIPLPTTDLLEQLGGVDIYRRCLDYIAPLMLAQLDRIGYDESLLRELDEPSAADKLALMRRDLARAALTSAIVAEERANKRRIEAPTPPPPASLTLDRLDEAHALAPVYAAIREIAQRLSEEDSAAERDAQPVDEEKRSV